MSLNPDSVAYITDYYGWREDSRKMVIVWSDSAMKVAGDGIDVSDHTVQELPTPLWKRKSSSTLSWNIITTGA